MRKIIQLSVGMYTKFEEHKDFDDQKFAIIVLCDDNTIWQFKENDGWQNIDVSPIIGKGSKPVSLKPPKSTGL